MHSVSLETNRTLGGVGALLIIAGSAVSFLSIADAYSALSNPPTTTVYSSPLSSVGSVLSVLSLVGLILGIIAMKGFSDYYHESGIFNNTLYALLAAIVGGIAVGGVTFALVFIGVSRNLSTMLFTPTTINIAEYVQELSGYLLLVVAAAFILGIIVMLLFRRGLNLLAEKSGVPRFRTAGNVLLASVVVSAVFLGVDVVLIGSGLNFATIYLFSVPGTLVSLAAYVLIAMGFFSMKPPAGQVPASMAAPAASQVRYCPYCGAPNQTEAAYCVRCGKKL